MADAWPSQGLEVRDGRHKLILRFGGKRFVRSLKTDDENEAPAKKLRVEENIRLVESWRLTIPERADVGSSLLVRMYLVRAAQSIEATIAARVIENFVGSETD